MTSLLKLTRPLHLLLAALTYFFGASLADYLGKPFRVDSFWLGFLAVMLMQMAWYDMGLVKKKVLITCGPTWIAIDKIRVISNRSTGRLGHLLAQGCSQAGAKVTVLEGPVEQPLKSREIRVVKFKFYESWRSCLKRN